MAFRDMHLLIGLASALTAAFLAASLLPGRSLAQSASNLCPAGSIFTGEFRDERNGNLIRRYPQCEPSLGWSPGRWTRQVTIATANTVCTSTWSCGSAGTSIYAPGSVLMRTPSVNRTGHCVIDRGDPESCGHCIGDAETPPPGACQTCRNPPDCRNPSLGWRTRQQMGCCV